jgi:hypothetical protein
MERDMAKTIALDRVHSAEMNAGVDWREFIAFLAARRSFGCSPRAHSSR